MSDHVEEARLPRLTDEELFSLPEVKEHLEEQARSGHDGYFGPGSMLWRVYRNKLIGLSGSRALLMQLSHPPVAQAVCDHSIFWTKPLTRAWATLSVMSAIFYGSRAQANAALARIGGDHRRARGWVSVATSASARWKGKPYRAGAVDSKLWVLCTFAETVYVMHDHIHQPGLSADERDRLWKEWRVFGALMRLRPSQMPKTYTDFRTYVSEVVQDKGAHKGFLDTDGRTVRRQGRRITQLWLSRLLMSGVLTWGLLPARFRHLVSVWPRFGKEARFALLIWLLRRLSGKGAPSSLRWNRDYLAALSRMGPEVRGLERFEVKLSRSPAAGLAERAIARRDERFRESAPTSGGSDG